MTGSSPASRLQVVSTVSEYLRVAETDDREAAWRDYEAVHAEVFEVYYREWGSPRHRARAASSVDEVASTIRDREQRALELIGRVVTEPAVQGLLDGSTVNVVLMVGHHTSNGWVAEFRGAPTLFLALEFLGEPPGDEVLVTHEFVHLVHQLVGADWIRAAELSTAGELFFEGLAVAASRQLCPDHEDSIYYWFDAQHPTWAGECAQSAGEVAMRLRAALNSTSFEVRRSFFAGPPQDWPLPTRAGYWFGDRRCTRLLADRDLAELIALDHPTVRRLVEEFLAAA